MDLEDKKTPSGIFQESYPVIKSKCNECYFYYAACGGFVEMINHFLTQEIATIYN